MMPRSPGSNTVMDIVGWEDDINVCSSSNYVVTSHALDFSRSFKGARLARALFGRQTLTFSGSQVAGRATTDLMADQFGLSPWFQGLASIKPTIMNITLYNQFYFGLDKLCSGLYAKIQAPLEYTRWDINVCDLTNTTTLAYTVNNTHNFPRGAVSTDEIAPAQTIRQALSGTFTFGDMKEPWSYGKFCRHARKHVRLSNIDLILGYNFLQNEKHHLGLYALTVAPTGNSTQSTYIFEPIAGNGKHWEAGGGISGHLLLWDRGSDDSLTIYLEGRVTHLFSHTDKRSFDFLHNGILSRYLLLKEFESDGVTYAGNLINGINFATRSVSSHVAVCGDATAYLAYRHCSWSFGLGYNIYGRSHESLGSIGSSSYDQRIFGIKGSEGTSDLNYTITGADFGTYVSQTSLNSTQHDATIFAASSVDNATAAPIAVGADIAITWDSSTVGPVSADTTILAYTSQPPQHISRDDLDRESGAAAGAVTNKFFMHLNYHFSDATRWCITPYFGSGWSIEFDGHPCTNRTSINQWNIWCKGGFVF